MYDTKYLKNLRIVYRGGYSIKFLFVLKIYIEKKNFLLYYLPLKPRLTAWSDSSSGYYYQRI